VISGTPTRAWPFDPLTATTAIRAMTQNNLKPFDICLIRLTAAASVDRRSACVGGTTLLPSLKQS
jgi:hypothetical protein